MSNVMAIGGVVLSLLAPPASAQPSTTATLAVEVASVNGSGCPNEVAAVTVGSDNASFTVNFSGYAAVTGDGAEPTDFRANCQFNLQIQPPAGSTYAIARADYNGFAHLAAGAVAMQGANYYFQGSAAGTSMRHSFTGPMNGRWLTTDAMSVDSLDFAPCDANRNLNINTELRVYRGTSDPAVASFMVMGQALSYHLAFQRCE